MKSYPLVAVVLIAAVACTRSSPSTAPRPLAAMCPVDSSPPRGTSRPGPPGSISIAFIDAASGRPLANGVYSVAILQYPDGQRTRIENSPVFEFTGLRSGRYVSGAMRIGYNGRVDTIDVSPTEGRMLVLPLTMPPTDACGGFAAVQVLNARPWWKFW